jgi:hypothetical protein
MPNAIDAFRAQRKAADAVYERLEEISVMLAAVRAEVDAVAGSRELRAVLQREEAWLSQASRTVSEVRAWREREAQQFWPSVARRWSLALVFALAAAWIAGAGYAYVANQHEDELHGQLLRDQSVQKVTDARTVPHAREGHVLAAQAVPAVQRDRHQEAGLTVGESAASHRRRPASRR